MLWCRAPVRHHEHFFACKRREIMRHEFTAVIEQDDEWFVGWSPEIPGANGQGHTLEACRQNLADAISLILNHRREDDLRGASPDAIRDVVRVA